MSGTAAVASEGEELRVDSARSSHFALYISLSLSFCGNLMFHCSFQVAVVKSQTGELPTSAQCVVVRLPLLTDRLVPSTLPRREREREREKQGRQQRG